MPPLIDTILSILAYCMIAYTGYRVYGMEFDLHFYFVDMKRSRLLDN